MNTVSDNIGLADGRTCGARLRLAAHARAREQHRLYERRVLTAVRFGTGGAWGVPRAPQVLDFKRGWLKPVTKDFPANYNIDAVHQAHPKAFRHRDGCAAFWLF